MPESVRDVAEELTALVGQTVPTLEAIGEAGSLKTRGPGTWSREQILDPEASRARTHPPFCP
jgi:hypothetical protein